MDKTSIPANKSSILTLSELRIKDGKLIETIVFPINGICPKCLTIASNGSSCLCGCSGPKFSC